MIAIAAALLIAAQDPPPIRLPCTADTMLAMLESEEHLSFGARSTLRLKGIEYLGLLDFDASALKGRVVEEARLFLHGNETSKLKTLGLSSVGTPWTEGRNPGGPAAPGEPSFREAAAGTRPWGAAGSDFHAVSFSRGGSIWFRRDLRREADGWISVEVPPALLHALLEGASFGIAVSDDKQQTGANNSVHAREQNGKAPYVLVTRSRAGTPPPSGARRFVPAAAPAVADRTADFLKPAPAPAAVPPAVLADGCRWRILHEGETSVDAAPARSIWDGRAVRLHAARGETVALQVGLEIPAGESRAAAFDAPGWTVHRVLPLEGSIDPLVPVSGEASGRAMFHLERHVPLDARPGPLDAPFALRTGKARVDVPVSIRVHAASLPAALGFAVSLNTYGFPQPERDFFRLAHEHRATLAVVPYTHRGALLPGVVPETRREGGTFSVSSWDAYDARWGPYLDGSAFKGLPRDGVPLDHMYWPMHEQWPTPINEGYTYRGKADDHWRDAPDPEEAFTKEFGAAFQQSVREFADHAVKKGWTRTRPHVFLNNKPTIRLVRREPEGAWWRLDEPLSVDDHLAIRYFAVRSREAARGFPGLPIRFRADLSRPQCRREILDGLVGLDVVAGLYRRYPELVFGRGEDVWVYGGVPNPGGSGQWGRAWAVRSFLDGADGIVPWQSVGDAKAWEKTEDTALILPPSPASGGRPAATLRLKGLRRGQQDVELLRLLLEKRKWGRDSIRAGVAAALGMADSFTKTSEEDAGRLDFARLDPEAFETLRRAVLAALEAP